MKKEKVLKKLNEKGITLIAFVVTLLFRHNGTKVKESKNIEKRGNLLYNIIM